MSYLKCVRYGNIFGGIPKGSCGRNRQAVNDECVQKTNDSKENISRSVPGENF